MNKYAWVVKGEYEGIIGIFSNKRSAVESAENYLLKGSKSRGGESPMHTIEVKDDVDETLWVERWPLDSQPIGRVIEE